GGWRHRVPRAVGRGRRGVGDGDRRPGGGHDRVRRRGGEASVARVCAHHQTMTILCPLAPSPTSAIAADTIHWSVPFGPEKRTRNTPAGVQLVPGTAPDRGEAAGRPLAPFKVPEHTSNVKEMMLGLGDSVAGLR